MKRFLLFGEISVFALLIVVAGAVLLSVTMTTPGQAQDTLSCVPGLFSTAQTQYLDALERSQTGQISAQELEQRRQEYAQQIEACARETDRPARYDDGSGTGVTMFLIDDQFVARGTKWGSSSPFPSSEPPRTPGGLVTYSFMANGVSIGGNSVESALVGSNIAISSLPTYQSCFFDEIRAAFDAWAAVADIDFLEVLDNGLPFDAPGSQGHIRIGAHVLDGTAGMLAHAYFPPPLLTSGEGDLHFDVAENWACDATSWEFDIGLVALHEIGHTLGLRHEPTAIAVMNGFYNPSMTSLQFDDIEGIQAIYGAKLLVPSATPTYTPTPSPTNTPTPTSTNTPTPTATFTATFTATATNTETPSPTATLVSEETDAPLPTADVEPTDEVIPTATLETEITPEVTDAATETATPTASLEPEITPEVTEPVTEMPSPTPTLAPTPTPVTLVSPMGNVASSQPAFSWNESPGAARYYLWISGVSNGLTLAHWYEANAVCVNAVCTAFLQQALVPGHYRWWVLPWSASGEPGLWSTEGRFTVPTPAATPIAPTGVHSLTQMTFRWTAVPGVTWYYLWISGSVSFPYFGQWYEASVVCTELECAVTPELIWRPGSFRWWVQTWHSESGYGPWSTQADFQITLPVPELVEPLSASSEPQPALRWLDIPEAEWYYVWISGPNGFTHGAWLDRTICADGTCAVQPNLTGGDGLYRWWVQPYSADAGYGLWSAEGNVTLAPAVEPVPIIPTAAAEQPSPEVTQDTVIVPVEVTEAAPVGTEATADPAPETTDTP